MGIIFDMLSESRKQEGQTRPSIPLPEIREDNQERVNIEEKDK